jgi:hypothetical protein
MKNPDDNDRLRAGTLPDDPAEGAGPAPAPLRPETPEERAARERQGAEAKVEASLHAEAKRRLHAAVTVLEGLPDRWANPPPATSTGLTQLDRVLNGGLRGGDLIALSGAAKAGKSTLAGQIAFEFARPPAGAAARPRGVVIYVSVEMPEHEVVSRWITREAFFLTLDRRTPWISYAAVLYGSAWRREVTQDPQRNHAIQRTLIDAMQQVAAVVGPPGSPHLFVQRAPSGTTPWDLRRLVRAAREAHTEGAPALLVVDPLQRLFAGPMGQLQGRALDQINANEIERVARVAEQLKTIADEDDVAVLFTSDTTKEAVRTSGGSSTSLRGSYALNHWATAIFGLHVAEGPEELAARLTEGGIVPKDQKGALESRLRHEGVPSWFEREAAVTELGRRYAFADCSGARNSAETHLLLGYVKGAMTFLEGDATRVVVEV